MVVVKLRRKVLNLLSKPVYEYKYADEVHISSDGCLVIKQYNKGVATYARGEWLSAKVED